MTELEDDLKIISKKLKINLRISEQDVSNNELEDEINKLIREKMDIEGRILLRDSRDRTLKNY